MTEIQSSLFFLEASNEAVNQARMVLDVCTLCQLSKVSSKPNNKAPTGQIRVCFLTAGHHLQSCLAISAAVSHAAGWA